MVDIILRTFRSGDENAINEGFNEVFGLSRTLNEWRWKFPDRRGGRAIVVAIGGDGKVLAHYGAIVTPFQAEGIVVEAGEIVDIYSRREARHGLAGARVFRETVREFVERFCSPDRLAVAYGFPGHRHMSLVRLGVASLGEAEMPPQPVRRWTRPAALAGRLWSRQVVVAGFEPGAADELWHRACVRYPVAAVRDAAWMRRRFCERPGVEYVHLSVRCGRTVHAVVVVRPGSPTTYLAELVWDGEDPRAVFAVDRAVGEIARSAGAERVEMWLSADAEAEEAFVGCGWVSEPDPRGLGMAAYTFHPVLDAARFPGRFYLTMGDADLV